MPRLLTNIFLDVIGWDFAKIAFLANTSGQIFRLSITLTGNRQMISAPPNVPISTTIIIIGKTNTAILFSGNFRSKIEAYIYEKSSIRTNSQREMGRFLLIRN